SDVNRPEVHGCSIRIEARRNGQEPKMGTRTITAAFSSRAQTELARERLRQLGIGADAIRISDVGEKTSAGRAARLEITGAADENLDPISALLKRLDAGRIDSHDEEWPPPDQAWLGHHQ